MGRPSIFNKDYHRIMRRRRILFRVAIVAAAFVIIFVTYNKSAILDFDKIADRLRNLTINNTVQKEEGNIAKSQDTDISKAAGNEATKLEKPDEQQKTDEIEKGEYVFKFPNGDFFSILYEKKGEDKRFTGIKPADSGIYFDIRDDGKAIVFDYHRLSDIWIYNIDGSSQKLSPDTYEKSGENREVYNKNDIMEEYDYNYIWAARPKFLKDGRIVYQSYLPWFRDENAYYLWVINSDGKNNNKSPGISQSQPIKYINFMEDGRLVVELDGIKYALNIDDGSKQKIE